MALIAQNPVQADMARRPSEYEFCSSHPSWSGKSWLAIEPDLEARSTSEEQLEVIEERLIGKLKHDPLDELVSLTPPAVPYCMRQKADFADETAVGLSLCHRSDVTPAM